MNFTQTFQMMRSIFKRLKTNTQLTHTPQFITFQFQDLKVNLEPEETMDQLVMMVLKAQVVMMDQKDLMEIEVTEVIKEV